MERRNWISSHAGHFTRDGDSLLPSRWLSLHLYDMTVLTQTSCGPELPLPVLEEGIFRDSSLAVTSWQAPWCVSLRTSTHWIDPLTAHHHLDLARENSESVLHLLRLVTFIFYSLPQRPPLRELKNMKKKIVSCPSVGNAVVLSWFDKTGCQ